MPAPDDGIASQPLRTRYPRSTTNWPNSPERLHFQGPLPGEIFHCNQEVSNYLHQQFFTVLILLEILCEHKVAVLITKRVLSDRYAPTLFVLKGRGDEMIPLKVLV